MEEMQEGLDALAIFRELGVLVTDDHFLYPSGLHGTAHLNKDAIYPHTRKVSLLCRAIAEKFIGADIDAVVGPANGGIILSQGVAHHLSEMLERDVLSIYAEKKGSDFAIMCGYDKIIAGKKVLVVEDVLNTYGTIRKVVHAVREANGYVVGIGALCDRSTPETRERTVSLPRVVPLLTLSLHAISEQECLLTGPCSKGVPINKNFGKDKELLIEKLRA